VLSRWSVTTCLALLAVTLIFVDVLLTVEVQRFSLEAHSLRKQMRVVSMELGALDSHWAARSSHMELDARANRLGLSVPGPEQVVLLPASFLEERPSGIPSARDELHHELFDTWTKLVLMGSL
jgi:hypothetical protein